MEMAAARLLDKVRLAGVLSGRVGAEPWPLGFRWRREFVAGRRTRGRGWGKVRRGRPPDVSASRWRQRKGPGAATASPRACRARSSVPGCLGKTTARGEVGWAGWASPWAPGKFF